MPVIQPGAFELFIIDRKTNRADKMQPRARCGACAGDIPGILRDLRFYKDLLCKLGS